jgi:hypothetical protein
VWTGWRQHLFFVKPNTIIAWQRKRFRDHWRRLSQAGQPGRPPIAKEIRDLFRRLSRANPTWGSPRIVVELAKLGIDVAESTAERYRPRPSAPPSPTWKAFLDNHVKDLVAIDFFTIPTVRFQVLFVFLVLAHHRRRVVHFNVTANPTSQWTAQQIVEAFAFDTAPPGHVFPPYWSARHPFLPRPFRPHRIGSLCRPRSLPIAPSLSHQVRFAGHVLCG